jgi:hypothetical protein
MSENEILRRQEYKKNRKKWIMIQAIALAVVVAMALGSFLVCDRLNRTYYIEYTETSAIDYQVQYLENDFFQEEWIEKDQTYIAFLIDSILADFQYEMNMGASNVGFDYTYGVNAAMVVADKNTGNPYYTVEEVLIPQRQIATKGGNDVEINEEVAIDFHHFNDMAKSFTTVYGLKNSSSTLVVTLDVRVLSSCDQFEANNENAYSVSLNIPLNEDTFSIHSSSSAPATESKVLACQSAVNQKVFLILGYVFAGLAVLQSIAVLAFMHLTKNEDITYTAKVRKLVSAYSSYIQRMEGEFDDEGYQILMIKTFNEMLGIRDTIQAPILMTENRDKTMSRFLIPTNTKLLYVFEIKVDNYDEIYGVSMDYYPEEDLDAEEEVAVLLEEVDEADLAEAMAQPDVVLSEIEFEMDDDDDFAAGEDEPGVEVVGVVWPEKPHKNKVYRYDPNGEILHEGDMVLAPTTDVGQNREVIRKAAVAHTNHRVQPDHIQHPLKKILGVIKRKSEAALMPDIPEEDEK